MNTPHVTHEWMAHKWTSRVIHISVCRAGSTNERRTRVKTIAKSSRSIGKYKNVYICVYTCIYIYIYIKYTYIHIYTYIVIYICIYIYVYTCAFVSMRWLWLVRFKIYPSQKRSLLQNIVTLIGVFCNRDLCF